MVPFQNLNLPRTRLWFPNHSPKWNFRKLALFSEQSQTLKTTTFTYAEFEDTFPSPVVFKYALNTKSFQIFVVYLLLFSLFINFGIQKAKLLLVQSAQFEVRNSNVQCHILRWQHQYFLSLHQFLVTSSAVGIFQNWKPWSPTLPQWCIT